MPTRRRGDLLLRVAGVVSLVTALIAGAAAAQDGVPITARSTPAASTTTTTALTSSTAASLPEPAVVPLKYLPPGSAASPVPSDEIFPPQSITLRFDHKLHVVKQGQKCRSCHRAANSSKASDNLLPSPDTCERCHDVIHSPEKKPKGERQVTAPGGCTTCHLGEGTTEKTVAKFDLPSPNLRFNHRKHLRRNINCTQCHGFVEEIGLATREQLPRMPGCLMCHGMSGASQGKAKGACSTCHLTEPSGRLKTTFSTGSLSPPLWLHGAAHTPGWITRHMPVAAANSSLCGSCHSSESCTSCHDGRVRPRAIHPNDWISLHTQAAQHDNPRCVSCHQLQSFCGDCHRRIGVARDTGSAERLISRRFHPTPSIWTTAPRSLRHHSWEAQRNLNACVSCHSERDCVTCHATKGLRGGQGVNPHPLGFQDKCGLALSRNPRPCLVCHTSGDPLLEACR